MDFKKLIKENIIDHNILNYENIKIKDKKNNEHILNLYSINISQKSDIRTMTIFNKIHSFLKLGCDQNQHFISSIDLNKLFDNMSSLILKYKLNDIYIEEGDKYLIADTNIIIELKNKLASFNINSFDYLYLRKYIPSSESKNDLIFKERFKNCNYYYLDIIFKEETINRYMERIKIIFDHLEILTKNKQNVLIFCQEINPLLDALQIIKNYDFKVIDPHPNLNKLPKLHQNFFSKSISIFLSRNFNFRISKLNKDIISHNSDQIIQFFQHGSSLDKNIFQNNAYYIKKFDLYIYNIHSNLHKNDTIIKFFSKQLPELEKNKIKNIILIGDFNFKLKKNYYNDLCLLFQSFEFSYDLINLPFASTLYEGIVYKLI